jgi:hypothetical protein
MPTEVRRFGSAFARDNARSASMAPGAEISRAAGDAALYYTAGMDKENSPRRRWFQFELRPLFLFTAVVAVGLWARPAADLLLLIGCFLVVVLGWAWLTVSVAHALADKSTGQSRTGRMRKCESPKTSPENGIPRTSVRPSTKDAWGC